MALCRFTGYVYSSIVSNVHTHTHTHTSLVEYIYQFLVAFVVIKARKCASALKRNAIKENIK